MNDQDKVRVARVSRAFFCKYFRLIKTEDEFNLPIGESQTEFELAIINGALSNENFKYYAQLSLGETSCGEEAVNVTLHIPLSWIEDWRH